MVLPGRTGATNSHYYDLKENKHEKWSKLRETRDWTELEK